MIKSNKKNKKKNSEGTEEDLSIDLNHLTCDHHSAFIAGFALVLPIFQNSTIQLSLIGLGGGIFPMFLHGLFNKMVIEAVEIDEVIVNVAKECFNFIEDDRMKTFTMDGIDYIKQFKENNKKTDIIILDVDSKDMSLGISCPPPAFVELEILNLLFDCVNENGMVIINLVCRSTELRGQLQEKITEIFPQVFLMQMTYDINCILFAFPKVLKRPLVIADITACLKQLSKTTARPLHSSVFTILEDLQMLDISKKATGSVEAPKKQGKNQPKKQQKRKKKRN